MTYEVEVKHAPTQIVASRRKHTPFAKLGESFADSIDGMRRSIYPMGTWSAGAPFAIYHNQPFRPEDVDVEFALPLTRAPGAPIEAFELRRIDGCEVATTLHAGSYAAIGAAYSVLRKWLQAHGRKAAGPPREIYLIGPEQTDRPEEYLTEIDIPLAA